MFPLWVSAANTDTMTTDQRVTRLEQQVDYLNQLSLPTQIEQLQQSVQDLRGLIQMLGDEIKQLQAKQEQLNASVLTLSAQPKTIATTKTVVTPAIASPVLPTKVNKQENALYQSAVSSIKNKQYSDAAQQLQTYLNQYPNGQFAANAHFWLGQLFIIAANFTEATLQFNTVVNKYPDSEKVPEAMLKLGAIAYDQSDWQRARNIWQAVVKKYPHTPSSKTAWSHLKQLQKAGY